MECSANLYLASGKLKVNAHGYWFTSGGEKGSFGFYPHLKDYDGYPIFSDTQINGDLRMAANWLVALDESIPKGLIREIFGDDPMPDFRDAASKIFMTDLFLSEESKRKWKPDRFDVKPRIEVDDDRRSVKEHMLVSLECSYLEGLELQCDIYLGYYEDLEALDNAKSLLSQSVHLLSGFGAFRSRGYGRGNIHIEWDNNIKLSDKSGKDVPAFSNGNSDVFPFVVKSLVNMRNKPVNPGSTQQLPSSRQILSGQLRGWFIKTYHKIFNEWPSVEDMACITFPDLYPCLVKDGKVLPGLPPPSTLLKNEENEFFDVMNAAPGYEEIEKFFKTKTKQLSSEQFVTNEINPSVFSVETGLRTRNTTEKDFSTKREGGLFVQEFVNSGSVWAGNVCLENGKGDFNKKARMILDIVYPIIGGCLFSKQKIDKINLDEKKPPFLVVSPIPYLDGIVNFESENYIEKDGKVLKDRANILKIKTYKSFNTVLKRPRRFRITISEGSVLHESIQEYDFATVNWGGFGQKTKRIDKKDKKHLPEKEKTRTEKKPSADFVSLVNDITRAQIGMIKEFLNKSRSVKEIKLVALDRLEKYKEKKKTSYEKLYADILLHIDEDPTGESMRRFVRSIIDELLVKKWGDKYGNYK